MVKARKAVAARRLKRAKAFTRPELVEMVRFLDAKKYGKGKRGEIQQKKSQLMHELSILLLNTFGTKHTLRQVQKRYSDLKVRQPKTLEAIRKQIKRENQEETEASSEESEATSVPTQKMSELTLQERTNVPGEEQYFTMHLETIDAEHDNVVQAQTSSEVGVPIGNEAERIFHPDQLRAMEERMIHHLDALESCLTEKIVNLHASRFEPVN